MKKVVEERIINFVWRGRGGGRERDATRNFVGVSKISCLIEKTIEKERGENESRQEKEVRKIVNFIGCLIR